MRAEVIADRFGSKASGEGPYSLPASAEIGLPILDEAHAALLARLNSAHGALAAGDQASARLQLEILRAHMSAHFDIEEQIMQALGFAEMRGHIRRHATSAAQLDAICQASLKRGRLQVGDLDLCHQGLIDEILRGDLELKCRFQSIGTRPRLRLGA